MKEHLKKGGIVGTLPGRGFNITTMEELGEKGKDITIFSGLTLPWACRIIEYAKSVEILGTKSEGDIGVLPQEKGEEVCQILQRVLGLPKMDPITKEFEGSYPVSKPCSIMTPTLFNLNALVHPSILYGAMQDIAKGRICTRGGEQIFLRGYTNGVIGDQRNDILIEWAQALMGKNI